MGVYIGTFTISSVIFLLSDVIRKKFNFKGKKIIYLLLVVVALIIPSILAGMRDYSIGTDVLTYGNIWFERALTNSFELYTNWATSSSIGYLYAVTNYIVAQHFSDPHYFYFVYNLLENIVIFIAIYRNRDIVNIPLGMVTYYLFFYNLFLNILRQGMALSLVLLSISFIRRKQYIRYGVTILVALQFHNTAIIGIAPLLIYIFSQRMIREQELIKNMSEKFNMNIISNLKVQLFLKKVSVILGIIFFIIIFQEFIKFLGKMGFIGDRYLAYIESSGSLSGGFYQHLVMLCLPILVVYLFNIRWLRDKVEYNLFLIIIVISSMLSFLTNAYTFLSRFTLYFDIIFILAIPYIFKSGKVRFTIGHVNITYILPVLYGMLYWLVIYGYFNSGETVPYIFMR